MLNIEGISRWPSIKHLILYSSDIFLLFFSSQKNIAGGCNKSTIFRNWLLDYWAMVPTQIFCIFFPRGFLWPVFLASVLTGFVLWAAAQLCYISVFTVFFSRAITTCSILGHVIAKIITSHNLFLASVVYFYSVHTLQLVRATSGSPG